VVRELSHKIKLIEAYDNDYEQFIWLANANAGELEKVKRLSLDNYLRLLIYKYKDGRRGSN